MEIKEFLSGIRTKKVIIIAPSSEYFRRWCDNMIKDFENDELLEGYEFIHYYTEHAIYGLSGIVDCWIIGDRDAKFPDDYPDFIDMERVKLLVNKY